MLKTLNTILAKPKKSRVEIGSNGKIEFDDRVELDDRDKLDNDEVNTNKIGVNEVAKEKNYQKI